MNGLADLARSAADRWGEPLPESIGYAYRDGPIGRQAVAWVRARIVLSGTCDGCGAIVRPDDLTDADELTLCVTCDRRAAHTEGAA